ncbi:MAG: ATP-binding protein [Muribaculaceae bacterium]|nr:ATP-binding protein [Muribaculaceae bacterium]
MKDILIGRENERKQLDSCLASGRSELIAVYGRRRVGKTFFISQVLKDRACFDLTGMENANIRDQLYNFYLALSKVYSRAKRPSSWLEAFEQLSNYIDSLDSEKKIITIDELPWLDTPKARFLSAFEHFWNSWAAHREDIKLIVCGSATSWMIDKLLNNRGGLHNRVTHQIHIAPFTLHETKAYLKHYGFRYNDKELAECYMVLGGVPYYYSLLSPTLSLAQNIDKLFFAQYGELRYEFENVYRSLFKHAKDYITIIRALAQRGKGLTRKQLLEQTELNNNAKFTQMLDELEKCGFIRCYVPFSKTKREELYQLIDAFTLFHLKFIEANQYQDEAFWSHSLKSPQYRAWSGYAFEMLCLNHLPEIKKALGISEIQCRACCWVAKADESSRGAQIDLLIDRADQTVNVCEMKFSETTYTLTKNEYESLENKVDTLVRQTGTRKSLMLTFITSFGLMPNKYSGHIQRSLSLQDFI